MKHQNDKAFRAHVFNAVTTEELNFDGVLAKFLADGYLGTGYKITPEDLKGRKNGENPASVVGDRIYRHLEYLAKEGEIQIGKVKGRKRYKR
jgi:hypothetical protein